MALVRDLSTRRGRSPMKQQQQNLDSIRREATLENIQRALEKEGIDSTQAFALLALQEPGHSRHQTSERIRACLTELVSPTEQVSGTKRRATRDSAVLPQHRESVSGAGHTHTSDTYPNDAPTNCEQSTSCQVPRLAGQRNGSSIPQDSTRFGHGTYSPVPTSAREALDDDSESEDEKLGLPRRQVKSFCIDDEEKVVAFIISRLKRMQQLADKKIAKAWIKGICPKKQAKFPYSNKKRKEETGEEANVPQWWPDLSKCKFTEPDHIKREERMLLCLHLLRLRPSVQQLFEWNNMDTEPNKTHQNVGWTAFLQELAGPEIFDELPREPARRVKQRRALMQQMYDLAQMEEDYVNGARDGDDVFSYEADEEDRKLSPSTKRSRRQSSVSDMDAAESRAGSVPAKRARRESSGDGRPGVESDVKLNPEHLNLVSIHHHKVPPQATYEQPAKPSSTPMSTPKVNSTRQSTPAEQLVSANPVTSMAPVWHQYEQARAHWIDHSPQFSSAPHDPYQIPSASTTFPGRQDFEFPRYAPQPHQLQINNVQQIPQPDFQPVPCAPLFSPSNMVPIPANGYPLQQQQQQQPQADQFDPNFLPNSDLHMSASQYFMPCQGEAAGVDFRPMPYQQQQDNQQQHMVAPQQHYGHPLAQLGPWR